MNIKLTILKIKIEERPDILASERFLARIDERAGHQTTAAASAGRYNTQEISRRRTGGGRSETPLAILVRLTQVPGALYPVSVIRGLRRTRFGSLLSVATLLSVLSLSASSLVHDDRDDALCNPAIAIHDHDAHRLVADNSSSPTTPAHCFICHWYSLRTVQSVAQYDVPATESRAVIGRISNGPAAETVSRQPSRAPPLA